MKFVIYGPNKRVGIVNGEEVVDANAAYSTYLTEKTDEPFPYEMAALVVPPELGAFITAGERALAGAGDALSFFSSLEEGSTGTRGEALAYSLSEVKIQPPLAQRARLFYAGANYPSHVSGAEGGSREDRAALEESRRHMREIGQRGFISFVENCVGPDEPVIHPSRTETLDFEGEVAVVIGTKCKDVRAEQAAQYFWGYLLMNDVSARRALPKPDNSGSRFARDKNFDSSKCAGPFVAVGEFPDAQDIHWETKVNGNIRQKGYTKDMIFSFAEMLEHLSQDMTFYPGDVISGGTCGGTNMDSGAKNPDGTHNPSVFLKAGDIVEISNPILGLLRNQVLAKPS